MNGAPVYMFQWNNSLMLSQNYPLVPRVLSVVLIVYGLKLYKQDTDATVKHWIQPFRQNSNVLEYNKHSLTTYPHIPTLQILVVGVFMATCMF